MSIRAGASTRDEVLDSIRIEGKGLVVDVGGGHRPFPAANLVLEKYPFEEVHRSAVHGLVHSAPVVIAGCREFARSHRVVPSSSSPRI